MTQQGKRPNLIFYFALLLAVMAFAGYLRQPRSVQPSYAEVKALFEQEKVKSFTLSDTTLTLILRFGVCIPEVCQNIQDTIKEKVETLTGYPVAKVNVNVVDLDDYEEVKEKKAAKAKEQEPPKEEKPTEEPKPEGDDE